MKFLSFLLILVCALYMSITCAEEVAITMDDPNCGSPAFLSLDERDQRILTVLKKNHVQAAYFVVGACVDNTEGKKFLQRWDRQGILLGNHTYSHKSINELSEEQYQADTLKNEKLLHSYSHYKNIFRFPYLKEGDTQTKRDSFRNFLRQHHYEWGSVTIDASDWYISSRLEKRLLENPNADIQPYKKYYLEHIWDRAQYYDALAKKVIGRSPKHTLLVHHNVLNALFLYDLIQMFRDKGWKVIDADEAFKDPIFKQTPDIIPAGESLIWGLAKETHLYDDQLRYPGEDESYEKEAMDKLGL